TWSASAIDLAERVGAASGSFLVDAHHGRWSTGIGFDDAVVRSVSVDASLTAPSWAVGIGAESTPALFLAEAEVLGGDGRVVEVGAGGATTTVRTLPAGSPRGLAVMEGASPVWFTGGVDL